MTDVLALPGFEPPVFVGRIIGRCPVKGCKNVHAVDAVDRINHPIRNRFGSFDNYVPAYRTAGGDLVSGFLFSRAIGAPRCPDHDRLYTFKSVEGTFVEGVSCGSLCRNAKGPSCDCQCAGAHHGQGWAS